MLSWVVGVCELPRYDHTCLNRRIPFRAHPDAAGELRCCTRSVLRELQLDTNDAFWSQQEGMLNTINYQTIGKSDWAGRMGSSLLGDWLLLQDMLFARIAHAVFLPDMRWHLTPPTNTTSSSTTPFLIAAVNMAWEVLPALRKLDDLVSPLRRHMDARTYAGPRVGVLTLIARDDVTIPDDASLREICRWMHRLAPHGIQLRLFAQNVAPSAHGVVQPYPIGILESAALNAFLNSTRRGQLASETAHRSTLLVCCCMDLSNDAGGPSGRRAAVTAVKGNGFLCDESDLWRHEGGAVLDTNGAASNAEHERAQASRSQLRRGAHVGSGQATQATTDARDSLQQEGTEKWRGLPLLRGYERGGGARASPGDVRGGRAASQSRLYSYYGSLVGTKFVLVPSGRGRDTYRLWEALACGAIPVMLSSPHKLDRAKLRGLPILWVASWAQVTRPFLEKMWERKFSGALDSYDMRRLHAPYWLQRLTREPLPPASVRAADVCRKLEAPLNHTGLASPSTWLAAAQAGHCGITQQGPQQCDSGTRGAFGLSAKEAASWSLAVTSCLAKCRECARCRYLTVSLQYRDCSWYWRCEKQPGGPDPAFRSAAAIATL